MSHFSSRPVGPPVEVSRAPVNTRDRQLDAGSYDLFVEQPSGPPALFGHVYVEANGSGDLVEHYALFDGYTSPSTAQGIGMKRRSTLDQWPSKPAFVSDMQGLVETKGPLRYIKCTCEESVIE